MASKKKEKGKAKTQELPHIEGKGVSPLHIPEIEKVIDTYEKKKEARCAESPGEMAAKKELKTILHQHRVELPVNGEGIPFYRYQDKDYCLEEKIRIKKIGDESDED